MTPRQGNFDRLLTLKIRKNAPRQRNEKGRRVGEVHGRCAGHREWLCSTDTLEQQESADEGGGP